MRKKRDQTEYLRARDCQYREFMASYTPEQKRLQVEEAKLQKHWLRTNCTEKKALLKNKHKEVVERLVVLAFPPDGCTERFRKQQRRKEVA